MSEHHSIRNVVDLLRYRASTSANTFTFLGPSGDVEEQWTCSELLRRAFGVAVALKDLEPGSRVAIVHPSGLAYASAFYGSMIAGLVPVPVYPPDHAALDRTLPRLEAIAKNAGVRAILTTNATDTVFAGLADKSPLLARLPRVVTSALPALDDDARPGPSSSDLAFLQYTSGSTGSPRGVRVSHGNLLHNSRLIEAVFETRPGTTGVTWLPPYHDLGLIGGIVQPVYCGMNIVMMSPSTFVRRPSRWLTAMSKYRARMTAAPNFAFAWAARRVTSDELAALDLSNWEVAVCGAEPIHPEVMREFTRTFGPAGFRPEALRPSYGLAEATLLVSARAGLSTLRVENDALTRNHVKPCETGGREVVSCGAPAPGVEVRIVDPATGQPRDLDTVGEIVIDALSVANGYHEAPSDTARAFTQHGLRTGDLGFMHDGQLFVVGRRKELLIIHGANFHPHDLEAAVVAARPELAKALLVAGMFDEEGDAVPLIVVEATARAVAHASTVVAVQAAVRAAFAISIEAAVVPKGAVFRTSSGKLERRRTLAELRNGSIRPLAASPGIERLLHVSAPETHEGAGSVLDHLRRMLAVPLRVRAKDLDVDVVLPQLGLDSVAAAELHASIAEAYGVELDMASLAGATLRGLALRLSTPAHAEQGPRVTTQASTVKLARPSLFFFASTEVPGGARGPMYAGLERAVRFADEAGFEAVWLPERHFHAFGAPFPNPAVLAAALAVQTSRIALRAGSVVMPLNHPLRVVEEWGMVDRLSSGRVALSFTSGWNPRDFVLSPSEFKNRREATNDGIETVRRLWRGESQPFVDGRGERVDVGALPGPLQRELDVWLTCTESRERFEEAGRRGFKVLTALLFQDAVTVGENIKAYRAARAAAGHGPGHVTLAVHTYVGQSASEAAQTARAPLRAYLASSVGLWQQRSAALATMGADEKARALEYATGRYMSGSLVGSSEECGHRVRALSELGADELACLTDFGVGAERSHQGLMRLAALWET